MIHQQRVSGWVPFLATASEMLMSAQAAMLYFGVILNDPNTIAITVVIACASGSIAVMVFYTLWIGLTLNVGNCPANLIPRQMPVEPVRAFAADTMTFHRDEHGFNWHYRFSGQQWREVMAIIDSGKTNLPYRAFAGSHVSRDDWDLLRQRLVESGLARRTKGGSVVVNDKGIEFIRMNVARSLPSPVRVEA